VTVSGTATVEETVDLHFTLGNLLQGAIAIEDTALNILNALQDANLSGYVTGAASIIHTDVDDNGGAIGVNSILDLFTFGLAGDASIYNFEKGTDLIDLSNLEIDDAVFGALGSGDGVASIFVAQAGGNTTIAIDTDDDGDADFTITLIGVTGTINAADFDLSA
jgi:hypothetical protein